jgi:hypothetical protein
MKKILYFVLLFSITVSCKKNSEPVPAESLPDDGINPTTETEIFDSLATVTSSLVKSMRIRSYYYSDSTYKLSEEESFHYEYDDQQRLALCTWQILGSNVKVTQAFTYNASGAPDKIAVRYYYLDGSLPPADVLLRVENDGTFLKIVPPAARITFFPPVNPSEDSYKYLAMINKQNQIVQMARSNSGLLSGYYSFAYDAKKNPVKMAFTFTDKSGQLVRTDDLLNITHTKYVRSPFNNPMFGLANELARIFGVHPHQWFREFGVNMPVKVSATYLSREENPSSRFGYHYNNIIAPLTFDFVYHYNTKKLPTLAVSTRGYKPSSVSVDSARFEYQ